MKKILLVVLLLLSACSSKPKYTLYFYYASTCPICKSFRNHVLSEIEENKAFDVIEYNIDDEQSMDAYAKTCSLLDGYNYTNDSGSVPFIVLDGYFARVGYELGDQEDMIQMIEDAVEGKTLKEIDTYKDYEFYLFKEGMSFKEYKDD